MRLVLAGMVATSLSVVLPPTAAPSAGATGVLPPQFRVGAANIEAGVKQHVAAVIGADGQADQHHAADWGAAQREAVDTAPHEIAPGARGSLGVPVASSQGKFQGQFFLRRTPRT